MPEENKEEIRYISKIQLPGEEVYDIKDTELREEIKEILG